MENWKLKNKMKKYSTLPYGNGRYKINKEGKVRWLQRRTYKLREGGYTKRDNWLLMKPSFREESDKPFYFLRDAGKVRKKLLINLMIEIYKPGLPTSVDIIYRDGNPANCALSNIKTKVKRKLSRQQVENIKRALLDGANGNKLAKRYKVSKVMIHKIRYGKSFSHILPAPPKEE